MLAEFTKMNEKRKCRAARAFLHRMFPTVYWTAVVLHSSCVRVFMDGSNRNVFFVSAFRQIATLALPAVFAVNWRNFRMDTNAVYELFRKKGFTSFGVVLIAVGSFFSFLACLFVPLSVLVSADNPKSGLTGWLVSMLVSQDLFDTYFSVGITCFTLNIAAGTIRLFGRVFSRTTRCSTNE